jgi:hypothetical protein
MELDTLGEDMPAILYVFEPLKVKQQNAEATEGF